MSARVKDGGIEQGLARARRRRSRASGSIGFGEAELDRAKRAACSPRYERAYNERDKAESDGFASELIRHYLTTRPPLASRSKLDLVAQFLPTITAAEIGDAGARARSPIRNRVVIATAPEKAGLVAGHRAGAARRAARRYVGARSRPWRDEIGRARAAREAAAAGQGHVASRDPGDRRHRADAVERRRGLAEADRLPQRPDHRSPRTRVAACRWSSQTTT